MKLSVVIPTLPGRESLLEQAKTAYAQTTDVEYELVIVRGQPSVGEGWNAGVASSSGEYLTLAADDFIPHPGWYEAAATTWMNGAYPSPRLLNPDGSLLSCGTLGNGMVLPECQTGTVAYASQVPFMDRDAWESIGPALPISYYSDDYLGYRARLAGYGCEVVRGYQFTHIGGPGTPASVAKSTEHRLAFLHSVQTPVLEEVAA